MQTRNADDFAARLEAMMDHKGGQPEQARKQERHSRLGNDFSEIAEAWPYLMESERNEVMSMVRKLRRR